MKDIHGQARTGAKVKNRRHRKRTSWAIFVSFLLIVFATGCSNTVAQKEYDSLASQFEEANAEIDALNKEIASLESEIEDISSDQEMFHSDNEKLASENESLKLQVAALEAQLGETATELESANAALESAKAQSESTATASGSATTNASPDGSNSATYVYIPNSGSKYHSTSTCSNMKNASKVTQEQAINMGYGKCSKCW